MTSGQTAEELVESILDTANEPELFESIRRNRCDRCPSVWATASVTKKGLSLYFCGHCVRAFMPTLTVQGFSVNDPNNELAFGAKENRSEGSDHS